MNSKQSRRRDAINLEPMEQRRLMCSLAESDLIPAPAWDSSVEADYAARAAHTEHHRLGDETRAQFGEQLAEMGIKFPAAPEALTGNPQENTVSIVWINRGQSSDNFADVFGANANAARNVVDAALRSWERVITSFNRSDGSNTLQVTVSMEDSGQSLGGGALAGAQIAGKPTTGAITLGRGIDTSGDGKGDGGGWYLDPRPDDSVEFTGSIDNAYSARQSSGLGADLYSVVSAEVVHCLGLTTGSQYLFRQRAQATNTGIPDPTNGNIGTFYTFSGPTIQHLMTSNNGGPTGQARDYALHTAEASAIIGFAGQTWNGSEDPGNARYFGDQRVLASDVTLNILRDAYDYSTLQGSHYESMYARLDTSNGRLTVRTDNNQFVSNDQVNLIVTDNEIAVAIDLGNDVPGTGYLPGAGDLPSFITYFSRAAVNSIEIQTGRGEDTIWFYGVPTVTTTIDGGTGSDHFKITDLAAGNQTYQIFANQTMQRVGGWSFTPFGCESEELVTSVGSDSVVVHGTPNGQWLTLDSRGGADTIEVGDPTAQNAQSIAGSVLVRNENNYSVVNVNNRNDPTPRTIRVDDSTDTGYVQGLTPAAVYWSNTDTSGVNLNAGGGNDTFELRGNSTGLRAAGGIGNDTFNISDVDGRIAGIRASLFIEGATGTDIVNVNDQNATDGNGLTLNHQIVTRAGGGGTIHLGGAERLNLRTGLAPGGAGVFNNINSTDPGTETYIYQNNGADRLNVDETNATGFVYLSDLGGGDDINVNGDLSGSATLTLIDQNPRFEFLTIFGGGRAIMQAGGDRVLTTLQLHMFDDAKLDLNDNAMIVDYNGASPIADLGARAASGFANGAWSGAGINSSLAAAVAGTALGFAEATALGSPPTFSGRPIDNTAVLFRYTRSGDADLDRTVGISDFSRLASNFNQSSRRWSDGDFNFDSTVNIADFATLAGNFNQMLPRSGAPTFGKQRIIDAIDLEESAQVI